MYKRQVLLIDDARKDAVDEIRARFRGIFSGEPRRFRNGYDGRNIVEITDFRHGNEQNALVGGIDSILPIVMARTLDFFYELRAMLLDRRDQIGGKEQIVVLFQSELTVYSLFEGVRTCLLYTSRCV